MTLPAQRDESSPVPAKSPAAAPSKAAATVLLSDVPDAATFTVTEAVPPPLVDASLGSTALASLAQRYDILGEAGHGAMGSVYKARDRETQQVVALKLVKPEFASDQTMMERFKNELLFARKITHKSVCRVYEFNRIGGVAYTSMEYVEGESLRSVLNRLGGLPLRKALDLALQICSGLREAHVQGIVHRDLKPENVMIDSRGNVKIMDFGIARSMESATRLTGAMMGTPAYMAPEQVSGKPVDYRTDIYSLGLVLYEVFTGKQAFVAENPVAVALKQVQETPVPPHEIEPAVPVSVERAILKCLEKDPGRRFQSIAELESALTSSGTRAVLASPSQPSPTLANREAIAQRAKATASPVTRKPAHLKRALPVAWLSLALVVVMEAAGGIHWMAVSRATKNLPPPAHPAAPAPPEFALDKQEPQRLPVGHEHPKTLAPADSDTEATTVAIQNEPAPKSMLSSKGPAVANISPNQDASVNAPAPAPALGSPRQQRGGIAESDGPGGWANSTGRTYLWIGRFQLQDRAQETARKIQDLGLPTVVVPRRNPNGEFYVVLSGPFGPKKFPDVMQQLESLGFTNIHPIKNLNLPPESIR
jgi:hypothetical protein